MFRVSVTPIMSTQNCNYSLRYCAATSLQRGQAWREAAAQKIWPVPEAVVTVLCTPDDGCGWHPKHVEWTCRIINILLCVYLGQLLIQNNDAQNHKHRIRLLNFLLFFSIIYCLLSSESQAFPFKTFVLPTPRTLLPRVATSLPPP